MHSDVELREPYVDPGQQRNAAMMGIYIVLATEPMLFGGLFLVALALRVQHGQEYVAASRALHVWIGTINTAVLLTSSLAVAVAVQAARQGRTRPALASLGAAILLGVAFLAIKAVEYGKEIAEGVLPGISDPERFVTPVHRQFMDLYLIATSLHAVHLFIGIVLLLGVLVRVGRRTLPIPERAIVVEVTGVYWHFVDLVWIFLYPALYLAR
jgi:cytochrome c oxidase subunit III